MKSVLSSLAVALGLSLVGCEYPDRETEAVESDRDYHASAGTESCEPTGPENCSGGRDEDCDGEADCEDIDCSGSDACPNCGSLDLTEGAPLALPDGVGGSYESAIDFTGFSDGQVVEAQSNIVSVCVVMEHSWLRDLQIELECPTGVILVLQEFLGTTGGEIFMGTPNDSDGTTPTPGVGAQYCWSPTAANPPMLIYANETAVGHLDLPPGDYQPVDPYSNLVGCTLNGDWKIRVTDLWGSDNGFIFSWGVNFDPAIVEDCSDWGVE